MSAEPDDQVYCGCCGSEVWDGNEWCGLCAWHVGVVGQPWERTWFARTGQTCPYEGFPQPTELAKAQYRRDLAELEAAEWEALG